MSTWGVTQYQSPVLVGNVTVTNGTTAGSYGSWFQLSASTPAGCAALLVSITGDNRTRGALRLALGASGSETAWLDRIPYGTTTGSADASGTPNSAMYLLPIALPSGQRLSASAAIQYASGGSTYVTVFGVPASPLFPAGLAGVDQLGSAVAPTGFTAVASGASNTWGMYVQLCGSTPQDYAALLLIMELNGQTQYKGALRIAVGAAGAEVVVLDGLLFSGPFGDSQAAPSALIPLAIPAGSRVAVACNLNVAVRVAGVY